MYVEDFTIEAIDESMLFGDADLMQDYTELAEQYLDGSENDDLVREAFPAIIAALAPLIPTIVQGVASLFNRPAASNPRPTAAPPRPVRPAVAPVATTAVSPVSSNAASSLLGLLQNPQVLAAITALAQGIGGVATGSNGASVPIGSIVNAIGGLAGQIAGSNPVTARESEYAYNELGELVEYLNDPIEQANTINALLN